MYLRPASSPLETAAMSTQRLRERFLVEGLTDEGAVRLVHTEHDRIVIGGVSPGAVPATLPNPPELRAEHFLQRRELGVVNTGTATGSVTVDGTAFHLAPLDCLYVGRGATEVSFAGDGAAYYLVSTRAGASFPTCHIALADAEPVSLGTRDQSNERTIYKYLHSAGVRSSELVLGVTVLAPGSMWNTMPCHTHDRRTEVYFYFRLPVGERVVHLMGTPDETRHLVVADGQAVISPPWSIHSGVGTRNYAFVWAMGGENQEYADVDVVSPEDLR